MAPSTQPSANTLDPMVNLGSYHLLTSDEAAAVLGVPVATLRTWRTRRRGYGPPAVRLGGNIRYRPENLFAWIEAHTEAEIGDLDAHEDDLPRLIRRRRPKARAAAALVPERPTR